MKDDTDQKTKEYIAKIALIFGGTVLLSELLIRFLFRPEPPFSLFRLMVYYFSGWLLFYLFESRSREWLRKHEIFFVIFYCKKVPAILSNFARNHSAATRQHLSAVAGKC